MPKIAADHASTTYQALATNGSASVIVTVSKNADGTPVKDPHK